MQFEFRAVPGWPALAWLAELCAGDPRAVIFHGPRVETRDAFFCEAIRWGEFHAGDLVLTDQIFGSGARIRGDNVVLVASGGTIDRLGSMLVVVWWTDA